MDRPRWLRPLQWLIGIAIVAFAGRRIAQQWHAVAASPIHFDVHALPLVAAALLIWTAYASLIVAWRLMVQALGSPFPLYGAARTWTVSSLGKYVPGKVWAIAGLAMLAKESGASPIVATASALLQQLVGLATGVLLVIVLGRASLQQLLPGGSIAVWGLAIGTVGALGICLLAPVRVRLLRLISEEAASAGGQPVPATTVLVSVGANLFAWVAYGCALWLLAQGVVPDAAQQLAPRLVVVAFTAAYVAGILAFMLPGGLGVREAVLAAALGPAIGVTAAIALAVVARLLFTVTELGAAAPFVILSKEKLRVVA